MTANVITYRERSAAREIGKVLGIPRGRDRPAGAPPAPLRVRGPERHARATSWREARFDKERPPRAALRAPLRRDPGPAAPPRPALGRDGHRPGRARRRGAAGARVHARPRGRAVGQGRLRGPGHREGGPAGPGHDGGAAGLARAAARDRAWRWTWRTCRRTTRRSTRCCRTRTRSASSRWRAARRWPRCRA